MPRLEDSVSIGGVEVPNRLYRAPLLECAGTGEGAVDRLVGELGPTAASGVGLLFQGATIVSGAGGCAAPNMTRLVDESFARELRRLTGTVHDHGGRIFVQLAHGGLRSLETWHAEYRTEHPGLVQPAVSRPPAVLRALDRLGLLELSPEVLSTREVEALAERFGRAAGLAADAGYDGVHLSGANMGIVQQFLSPYYNRRDDRFADGVAFLEAIHDAVRAHAGDVPLVTKVPAETAAPRFVRRHLTRADAVDVCRRLEQVGYDAVVPVRCSTFWDMSIVRGAYPERAWGAEDLQEGYASAFGGRGRARLVSLFTGLQARRFDREPAWNAGLCREVREAVDVPVLCEGGVRERERMDDLLAGEDRAADLVGLARPFYAEPRLGARLLDGDTGTGTGPRALCESCNNCTVPQVTGARGRCRTPSVVRKRGELEREGVYERSQS
jgi:2,4-dienoyl-CoA reductase-like NADH-dependent reductase (Old Yellow Enzyme family)